MSPKKYKSSNNFQDLYVFYHKKKKKYIYTFNQGTLSQFFTNPNVKEERTISLMFHQFTLQHSPSCADRSSPLPD